MVCVRCFRDCLQGAVVHNEEAELRCPYQDNDYACNASLQDREIKAVCGQWQRAFTRGANILHAHTYPVVLSGKDQFFLKYLYLLKLCKSNIFQKGLYCQKIIVELRDSSVQNVTHFWDFKDGGGHLEIFKIQTLFQIFKIVYYMYLTIKSILKKIRKVKMIMPQWFQTEDLQISSWCTIH